MSPELVILLTAVLVAIACALPGVFLVLRRLAMVADAISHAILPGIVVAYFLAHGPNLLSGFVWATLAGVLAVVLIEALHRTRRVREDAAIGIVFPALFALGTFLVALYFANLHVDTDAVLYGEIALAPFDSLIIGDLYLGPQALWVMGGLAVINLAFILIFYKELKLATFDPGLAAALGFAPALLHYGLMTVVAVTTVGAFTAVGAILVVALLIVPAATAYLLTDRLPMMIGLAVLVGALCGVGGYGLAVLIDGSISGSMVAVGGLLFGLALLLSPAHGLVTRWRRHRRLVRRLAADLLAAELDELGGAAELALLRQHLRWEEPRLRAALGIALRAGLIVPDGARYRLTPTGQAAVAARDAAVAGRATPLPSA
jgi:manganese/zinc/iron transport system permease protein